MQHVRQKRRTGYLDTDDHGTILASSLLSGSNYCRASIIWYSKCGWDNVCKSDIGLCQCEYTGESPAALEHPLRLISQSQLSLLFVLIQSMLARRHRLAPPQAYSRFLLNSICTFFPRILIMLWMVAAATGMIVAARQPRCLSTDVVPILWKMGLSCQLHRSLVAMAVVAL